MAGLISDQAHCHRAHTGPYFPMQCHFMTERNVSQHKFRAWGVFSTTENTILSALTYVLLGFNRLSFTGINATNSLSRSETINNGVARVGTLSLCRIQSSHRFGIAASSPNLSEPSLAGSAAVLGFAALTLGPLGLASLREPSQPTRHTGFRQI